MTATEKEKITAIAQDLYTDTAQRKAFISGATYNENNPTRRTIQQILRCYSEGKSSEKDVETIYKSLYQ
jgi:hypothetical protein